MRFQQATDEGHFVVFRRVHAATDGGFTVEILRRSSFGTAASYAALVRKTSLVHRRNMQEQSSARSLTISAFLRQISLKPAASVVDQLLTYVRGKASLPFSWAYSECTF